MEPDLEYWLTGSTLTRNYVKFQPASAAMPAYVRRESPNTALVCAVGNVNYDFYLGLAAVNSKARATHFGAQIFNPTQSYTHTTWKSYGGKDILPKVAYANRMRYADEAVHLTYLYPSLKAGEVINFEYVHVMHPSDQDSALKNLENVLMMQPTDVLSGTNATLSFAYKNAKVHIVKARWYVYATLIGDTTAKWHQVKTLNSVTYAPTSLYSTTLASINTKLYQDGLVHVRVEADTAAPVETFRKSRVVEIRNAGPLLCIQESDPNNLYPLVQGDSLTLTLNYCPGSDTSVLLTSMSAYVETALNDEVVTTQAVSLNLPWLPFTFVVPAARFENLAVGDVVTVRTNAFVNELESTSTTFTGVISEQPTTKPTVSPTAAPTVDPSAVPSASPTADPTTAPSAGPTMAPTVAPSAVPTAAPSAGPTKAPTVAPSADPTTAPSAGPTTAPTVAPSANPTTAPSAGPTMAPTAAPSADPTLAPTASPTRVCLQWALGDYGETCSTTCGRLDRVCKNSYFEAITTQEEFYAVVGSAVNVRTGGALGSAESFCGSDASFGASTGAPAVLSALYSSATTSSVRNTCSFPQTTAEVTARCDAHLPLDAFRRFCPCVDHSCDGAWYLGYSGDSCDATCGNVGGECQADPLSDIVDADSFESMVATTTVLGTNEMIGSAAAASFCNDGTNLFPFATAPAAVTLSHGANNQTQCAYPTSSNKLHGECGLSFQAPPAQRFCNCRVVSGARRLFVDVTEEAPQTVTTPVQLKKALPSRLRGSRV